MSMASDELDFAEFIPSEGGDPVYSQIARWLAGLVASKDLMPGDRLPNERDLAAHVGVSRPTLRQALGELERNGLIRRIPGRKGGAFVTEGQVLVNLSLLPGLAAQIKQSQRDPGSTVLTAELRTAPTEVSRALGISDESAYFVERIRRAGDREIALERSWFPVSISHSFLDKDLSGSLYEILDSYGQKPVEAEEFITPVIDEHAASLLGMPAAQPLLHVQRTALDSDGRPVEFSNDLFRPDRVQFMVTRRIN